MPVIVDWSKRAEHMRRKHGVQTAWANEAVNDALAVWLDPDPKSDSGISVRVIGYSPTARTVLVVILVPDEDLRQADYWGASGWRADGADKRMYDQMEGDEGDGEEN